MAVAMQGLKGRGVILGTPAVDAAPPPVKEPPRASLRDAGWEAAKAQLPSQPEINDTLGWIYYKKGLTTLALGPLSQAVDKGPKVAAYQFHLGMALAKNGETDKARTALQAALAIDPSVAGAADARKTLASFK